MAEADASSTFKTIEEVEASPGGLSRRWLAELALADEAEKEWRDEVAKCWTLYQSKRPADNTFNIFWSNVETRRPAIYNSTPRPDVRRRFRDPDPVGKAASNILERALAFSIDQYDFDGEMKKVVLDTEVSGRGVARAKYLPEFAPGDEPAKKGEDTDVLYNEAAECQHVQWDDFRHGPGKVWTDVEWVAFRHEFHYDELKKFFGKDVADGCKLNEATSAVAKSQREDVQQLLQVCEVWEIWDKVERRVLFISEGYKHDALDEVDDPLRLIGFFPMVPPVYAIEDTTTLVPAIPYVKYEQQAKELNRVTYRINKIVNALKVRGAYEASLSELPDILKAEDQEFIPIQNASQVANMGGLDKAIWIMPIDKLVQVLSGLLEARTTCIQTIYELTGISDIQRGVSNPHETAHAQDIKSQWGSMRLQRVQRDVQRFVRDLFRIKSEIFSEHFSPETLATMTGIKLPSDEDKAEIQQAMQQMQAAQQQPPQPGAPPPQQPDPAQLEQMQAILKLPTWKEVMEVLKSDAMRQYRIGIETDSTIAETIMQDTQGLQEAVTAISNLATAFAPAIQMGLLSVDVFKTIATRIARSLKMGEAVEDAIDAIKQPPPQQNAAPQDNSVEVAKIKEEGAATRNTESNQTKLQLAEKKAQNDAHQTQLDQQKAEYEARDAERQRQFEAQEAERERQHEMMLEKMKAEFANALKLQLGSMQQETQLAGIASKEKQTDQQLQSQELQHAATLESTDENAQADRQSANVQAAAKIESSDAQTAAKIESSDQQTKHKTQSAERQTKAKNDAAAAKKPK